MLDLYNCIKIEINWSRVAMFFPTYYGTWSSRCAPPWLERLSTSSYTWILYCKCVSVHCTREKKSYAESSPTECREPPDGMPNGKRVAIAYRARIRISLDHWILHSQF
jgi:hypothetical protein